MRVWVWLELEPQPGVPISHAHLEQPHPLATCGSTPWPPPGLRELVDRPRLVPPGILSLASLPFRSSHFALNHAPTLHWLFFFRLPAPSRFVFSSLVHNARSPALTEPCRRTAPRALGLRRGQGATAGPSSRRGFGRSRGRPPPRMRSRSIDLVPDTGRPRRRSCCRSSETWGGGRGEALLGGLRATGGSWGWTFGNREKRDWGPRLLGLQWGRGCGVRPVGTHRGRGPAWEVTPDTHRQLLQL